jgi:putative FmdB family regulatory protein
MPIYEYRCTACGAEFEELVRSDTKVACPECRTTRVAKQLSVPARAPSGAAAAMADSCIDPPAGGCCGGGACHQH